MDNLVETCTNFAARALGLKAPLRITHQIDNCTEGWYFLYFQNSLCQYVTTHVTMERK